MVRRKTKYLVLATTVLSGLYFTACKTTPTPSTPLPQPQETQETKDSRRTTSSQPTGNTQPGSTEKSKTGQTTPSETAQPQPQTDQTGAEKTSATRSEESAQNRSQSQPTTPQTANSKLAKARDDLRVSQATEKRIASELEALKKSGNASEEEIGNYETYLERVQAMVAENRKTVEKMEGAYARHSKSKASETAAASESRKPPEQSIPEEQTQDQVAELDRQLSASLSEFDSMLLKEMETIESQSSAKMRDLAQAAAEAAKRLKEKGVDLDTGESEAADEASAQSEEGRQAKAGDQDRTRKEKEDSETDPGEVDDAVASSDRPKGDGSGPKRDPGSRYSKEDDDIVARQLREAAENETDPELKEKLWKEYEDYKRNTQ